MDTRINKLQNKISKLNNNQKGSKKINLESKINSIWLESLELISQNKITEAYD